MSQEVQVDRSVSQVKHGEFHDFVYTTPLDSDVYRTPPDVVVWIVKESVVVAMLGFIKLLTLKSTCEETYEVLAKNPLETVTVRVVESYEHARVLSMISTAVHAIAEAEVTPIWEGIVSFTTVFCAILVGGVKEIK